MTKEQTKIVNKLRLIWVLRAWKELDKKEYQNYLVYSFSCLHCRCSNLKQTGCKLNSTEQHERGYVSKEFRKWCLGWLKKENWLDKPEKM